MPVVENSDVRMKMKNARLYCVSTPPGPGQSYEKMFESVCRGGADIVQLRDKSLSSDELLSLARRLLVICRRYGSLFIVNDRLDVALACDADGVHLGQEDMSLAEARRIVQDYGRVGGIDMTGKFLVGVSTHSLEQALAAESGGANYIGCGPVFATPTKPDYGAVGLELVSRYRQKVNVPFTAIGGIDEKNVRQVVDAGARCVAVVRAVFGQSEPESAARAIKKIVCSGEGVI